MAPEGDGIGNPVGELQELTQKKLMKPPVYEFTSEQGPPHAREFVCTVKLGKIQEKGMFVIKTLDSISKEENLCNKNRIHEKKNPLKHIFYNTNNYQLAKY